MQTILRTHMVRCQERLAQVQQELEQVAQRQQALVQESFRLQGAIRELEAIVVAVPTDGAAVLPVGD